MPEGKQGFQKGHKCFHTDESKKKLSDIQKSKWKNSEFRKKILDKMKGGNITSFKKGCNNWKGKKHTMESRNKMSNSHKGKIGIWKNKPRENIRNEKHWNWKGGTTDLRRRIMVSYKYRQWRSDVFTRDDYTCQHCGKRGVFIEADHIKLFSLIIKEFNIKNVDEALLCEELWNINNGRTLCKKCHNKTKYGREKI